MLHNFLRSTHICTSWAGVSQIDLERNYGKPYEANQKHKSFKCLKKSGQKYQKDPTSWSRNDFAKVQRQQMVGGKRWNYSSVNKIYLRNGAISQGCLHRLCEPMFPMQKNCHQMCWMPRWELW